MFYLGSAEIILLLIIVILIFGVPIAAVLLIVFLDRRQRQGQPPKLFDHAALEEENRKLREEIARLKGDKA
jgi:hypothetical protein